MNRIKAQYQRLILVGLLASALGGCVAYGPIPPGSYIVNADGTRTYPTAAYVCPEGYTCYSQDYTPAPQTYYSYPPSYYSYPPGYVGPSPYFWPPLFFGLGYYYGGGHYHHGGGRRR